MSLETAIQNLADAINALATAHTADRAIVVQPEKIMVDWIEPPKRGRPKKESVEPVASPAPAAVEVAPPPEVLVVADGGGAASITADEVRNVLIEIVTTVGKEACTAVCMKHGAKNLSALDPAVYPALMVDAQKVLASAVN